MNILKRANEIINERSEEKERQYGPMTGTMENMRDIFNAATGRHLSVEDMHIAMVAMKLARERHAHREDNLLDAVAYLGALNNYHNEIEVAETGIELGDIDPLSDSELAKIYRHRHNLCQDSELDKYDDALENIWIKKIKQL